MSTPRIEQNLQLVFAMLCRIKRFLHFLFAISISTSLAQLPRCSCGLISSHLQTHFKFTPNCQRFSFIFKWATRVFVSFAQTKCITGYSLNPESRGLAILIVFVCKCLAEADRTLMWPAFVVINYSQEGSFLFLIKFVFVCFYFVFFCVCKCSSEADMALMWPPLL